MENTRVDATSTVMFILGATPTICFFLLTLLSSFCQIPHFLNFSLGPVFSGNSGLVFRGHPKYWDTKTELLVKKQRHNTDGTCPGRKIPSTKLSPTFATLSLQKVQKSKVKKYSYEYERLIIDSSNI